MFDHNTRTPYTSSKLNKIVIVYLENFLKTQVRFMSDPAPRKYFKGFQNLIYYSLTVKIRQFLYIFLFPLCLLSILLYSFSASS